MSDPATKAGARVDLRLAEGQSAHAFPADFAEKIAAWVRFVEGEKPPVRSEVGDQPEG